ncbi:DUF5004 domain-containing protein [Joostella sp. CR20]|uniref:DUF5004 domain-containing protein n=1 Tax=Joostella sp. CR20 TaxID=2804312 RepID=UPI00313EF879
MKKRKLIATTLFLALSALFVGCSDDDNSVTCTPAYTGELTENEAFLAGTWELSALTSSIEIDLTDDNENNPSTDIFMQQTECENDIVYIFNTDRTFSYEIGQSEGLNCSYTDGLDGTWKLTGSTITFNSCFESTRTVEFNDDLTAYSFDSLAELNGQQFTVTYTFTKATEDIEPAE